MSQTIRTILALVVLLSGAAIADQMLAQSPPQINVPYRCANGITYTVLNCKPFRADQWCRTTEEQNGNLVTTMDSAWSSMTGRLQGCTTAPAAANQAASGAAAPGSTGPGSDDLNDSRWDCGGGTNMIVLGCEGRGNQEACFVRMEQDGKLLAQTSKKAYDIRNHVSACKAVPALNPRYLVEFPNALGVVQGMVVGKPQENVVRSIGALYQLSEIIRVLAGSRALTPDEEKLLGDYSKAQAALVQSATKAFPGQQFDPASNPYRLKRNDPKFGFEGIPVWTLLTKGIQSAFARMVGGSDDEYAMAVSRERNRAIKQAEDQMKAQQAEASYAKDPGSVAARHCLESGRSEMECLGEGMKVGLNQLTGGDMKEAIIGKTPNGLRFTGVYSGNGFSLNFRQDMVYVFCGSLLPEPRTYTVDRSGMQVSVNIPVTNPPLILSYRPDGSLSGQGRTIAVAGEVPAGGGGGSTTYQAQTTTTTTQRQLDPGEEREYSADQLHQNGGQFSVDQQTTSTSWTPTFHRAPTVPKTERCTVGTLPPGGESIKDSALLTQLLGSKASKSSNSAPGLRLNGTYEVPGGLKIEFRDDSATLECGESFNSEAYTVVPESGQFIVKFQNNTGPLSLVLQPNGSLTGSGEVNVTGRRAIQAAGGGVDYQPRNAQCSLGTFTASR